MGNVIVISKELAQKQRPNWAFKQDTLLSNHVHAIQTVGPDGKPRTVHEFIGTDDFAAAFYERQRYEVDAGRDEEPTLYEPLYNIIEDRTLPRNVPINRIGPAGVVFQQINEGGEVQFVTVGQSNFSVPIYHHAVGLEYSDDLVEYNELWSIPEVERQMGVSYNAKRNHIHLNPFIAYAYGAANQTTGVGVDYDPNITLPEAFLRTIELAITNAIADTTNPRRGPYALLVATGNLFTVERAINVVPQQGITRQSSAIGRIQTVIAYDGWTGEMGGVSTTYGGVTVGKSYLIDLGRKSRNLRSYVKHGLRRQMGNPDVSRFILEQTVWDWRLGMYADIAASTEEITWPTVEDITPA